uniref:Putative secreted protein n=1 Tax=Haematobia irritans TaxID=7368 RepID=A0A1L8EIT4_HAEIR
MKFTVFALIAAFCLVAVSANGSLKIENEDLVDYDYIAQDLADEIMEIEPYGLFTGMYSVIKAALRTVKGLNCTIKEVLEVQNAAQAFVNNVQACGDAVSKKLQNLINACQDIIDTCKSIMGINESICGNTDDDNETDSDVQTLGAVSDAKTAHKCFVKMVRKVNKLKKQVKKAVKMIKDIKKVPGDTSDCAMDAINTLENTFVQFPANVKTCSKLTS